MRKVRDTLRAEPKMQNDAMITQETYGSAIRDCPCFRLVGQKLLEKEIERGV